MAHALDEIHTSASRCETLTTFNVYAPPPEGITASESRPGAGELVQNGFSGLYNRFREAVGGVTSPTKTVSKEAKEVKDASLQAHEASSKRSSVTPSHASRLSVSSLTRTDTAATMTTQSASGLAVTEVPSSTLAVGAIESRPQAPQSTKSSSISLMTGPRSTSTSRQSLPTKATSSVVADPTITPPVALKRDASRSTTRTEDSGRPGSTRRSLGRSDQLVEPGGLYDVKDGRLPPRAGLDDASSIEGSLDVAPFSPVKVATPSTTSTGTGRQHARNASTATSVFPVDDLRRMPAVIDRISRSRSPRPRGSRDSSPDMSTAAASAINTSAHGSIYHGSFGQRPHYKYLHPEAGRIPGTTRGHERATDQINAQLDKMRRQVLSKEFWMKDDTVKECFLCQTPFSAFRRKHHCRTCGCIFDSKCTTVVSGEKFGVQGSLRVCKNCLQVITRRFDGSGSDDSGDERSFLPKIFGSNNPKDSSDTVTGKSKPSSVAAGSEGSEDSRPLTTPMMAIPATRRVRDSAHRASAVLEIDAPQLSRPGSSRSLKSLATSGRPQSSAGHKRHHSKHGFLGRFKAAPEQQAPFRKGADDENFKKPKFPAFHDDNIIDPDLADYMSEDSSGDEQMGIFATMAGPDVHPASYEQDRPGFPSYMTQTRKHRHRHGEKSISGMSYVSRGVVDDTSGPTSLLNHRRSTRRRNLSNVSGTGHLHVSPRPKSAVYKGPSASSEMLFGLDHPSRSGTYLTRSDSLRRNMSPKRELNESSLRHVDKLLHQLLDGAQIPNSAAWQKSLVPILLHLTDDVTPDVVKGEDMDLRHYVKLKKIPGGRPGDTSYMSGVVFTKNLALKSMPRRITNPRIVLVTFPIEYQRHQQHFMSLQPVIEQEKEFLRVVVQRITNLRPQLLLAQKGVSGVALQYLSEANVSVAYNVKDTVIEAVARCAEAEIIETLDMLALPVRVGRCSAFEVRTFVNNDYPGRKKSYIFLSGCRPDLGCTIALRGAHSDILKRVKHIMEFMVYVVYNLKLESSLLRDESVEPPDDSEASLANSVQGLNESFRSISSAGDGNRSAAGPTMVINHPLGESAPPSQTTADSVSVSAEEVDPSSQASIQGKEPAKVVSLHANHSQPHGDSQVPDDVPMPTFYSDMVAKYETKILSASPYVKFEQPYLLMKAREQERRLLYLRRLRDQDAVEEDSEKSSRHKFQLIKPEMVEKIGQKAPRQVMEVLHAVHDAEYDKALFNYQTQTRQWETYIQGNLDLFDPYSHQNIVVLYSVICTDTKIPCIEPGLVAINFYDEQHVDTGMDADCTLGQYIEDLAFSKNDVCNSNGCEKKLVDHHRTYVHDQYRITVFVDHVSNPPLRRPEVGDGITMWTYCKLCKKDSEEVAMSDATFKYSFGKYLELLYWGRGLKIKNIEDCPHDHHRDHVRYFSCRDSRVRIHWDPIDLLEIVVPRARITWKVANDLKLKNEIYNKMEERWGKFMSSVRARLKSIRTESLLPEKAELCKAEVERLMKKTQEEQPTIIRQMQRTYVESKYYEVVPFNKIIRDMLEKAGEWDQAFAKFEADFLGDRDMRQITMMQLKKIFTDNESKDSLVSSEGTVPAADGDDRTAPTSVEASEKNAQSNESPDADAGTIDSATASHASLPETEEAEDEKVYVSAEGALERVESLDLAGAPESIATPTAVSRGSQATGTTSEDPAAPIATQIRTLSVPNGGDRNRTDPSNTGQSLSEKVDQMRREQVMQGGSDDASVSKAAPDRGSGRKSLSNNVSPSMARAASRPARMLSRSHSISKTQGPRDVKATTNADPSAEATPDGSIKVDKKLSDRLGLTALKNRGKTTTSNIPRPTHKRRESKVSTLARHFEQLSREFEKERLRNRKERAASLRQPRARLPRTTTKAIVQVYDDVAEAFEEHCSVQEHMQTKEGEGSETKALEKGVSGVSKSEPVTELPTPVELTVKIEEQLVKPTADVTPDGEASQATSEDEMANSDLDSSLADEFLPDIQELAEALEPSTEIPLELPKHQKTSLMKYLTNFWAETSASGWPPLDYPINPTDHIFVDSDIIVREDEPSSVIALALNSDDYQTKLSKIRREAHEVMQREVEGLGDGEPKSLPASDSGDWVFGEAELEKSLLRATGTHLKYQFKEGAAMMTCKIFYAEQFDALRRKCGVAERVIETLSRCLKWDSRGGKTKSVFLKTLDDRLVLKVR